MTKRFSLSLGAASFIFVTHLAWAAQDDSVAALFSANPVFEAASLSPSGRYVAFATTLNDVPNVIVSDLGPGGKLIRTAMPNAGIRYTSFYDDDHLLVDVRVMQKFPLGSELFPFLRLAVLSPSGTHAPLQLGAEGELGQSNVLDRVVDFGHGPNDKNHIYISATNVRFYNGHPIYNRDVFRINLDDGKSAAVESGIAVSWIMNGSGEAVAKLSRSRKTRDPKTLRDTIIILEGHQTRSLLSYAPDADNGVLSGLALDGRSLVFQGRRNREKIGLHRLDLQTGEWGDPVFYNSEIDVLSSIRDERTLRIIGAVYQDGLIKYRYFEPERQRVQQLAEDVLPGRSVQIISISDDQSRVLVVSSGLQNPPVLHLINLQTKRIDTIAESYPQLRGVTLGETRHYSFKGSDGASLSGTLTLPPGKDAHALPLLIIPSGGDIVANFDYVAQYLAYRGYAVMMLDRRSDRTLADLDNLGELEDWLATAQSDVASALDDLAAHGIIDPKRVCISGGNTAGYVAMYLAATAPERFSCVASIASMLDIRSSVRPLNKETAPEFGFGVFNYTFNSNRQSYTLEDMQRLSPANRAGDIKPAVLLVTGENVVVKNQAEAMRNAMMAANRPIEYLSLPKEDGSFALSANRMKLLTTLEAFLADHIGSTH